MKLNKLLVLFAAMVLSTAAFAGNASSNSAMIEESVDTAASAVSGEGADEKTVLNTQNAIKIGLLTVDVHRDLNEMTENDKAIVDLMEQKMPAILNKIEKSSDDVYEELQPVLQQLTTLILKNQTLYPDKLLDKETAEGIVFLTTINEANRKELLSETAAYVLGMELQQAIFGQ